MKKLAIMLLAISFMVSCGKTNKRKLDNEWKIESYEEKSEDNTHYHAITKYNQNSYFQEFKQNDSIIRLYKGIVSTAEIKFDKNGTWEKTLNYTIKEGIYDANSVEIKIKESGNWQFINKGGGIQKK